MPMPFLQVPEFPNVPNVLGVPSIVRAASAQATSVLATLNGLPGTIIPQGILAATNAGDVFSSLSQVTIPSIGNIDAVFNSIQTGAIPCLAGQLDILKTSIPGLSGITNMLPGILGNNLPTPAPPELTADGAAVNQTTQAPKWGIYNTDGQLALLADSAVAFSFQNEYRISDYPVEQGGFESYNKVATPYDARVVLAKGGSQSDRQDFLTSLDDIISALTLWDVVTPEKTYTDANIIRYDYDRSSRNGVSLLTVTVALREVRQTSATQQLKSIGTAPLENTQSTSAADPVTLGTIQPQFPTTVQIGAITQSWAESAGSFAAQSLSGLIPGPWSW